MRGQGSERLVEAIVDPFTNKESTRLVRVLTRNQRAGETVASSRITVESRNYSRYSRRLRTFL